MIVSRTTIGEAKGSDRSVISIENDHLCLKFLPHLGGKIAEITRKGREGNILHCDLNKLFGDDVESSQYLPPNASGFDECFPSVAPSEWDINGKKALIPDHGFLWQSAWNYSVHREKNQITLIHQNQEMGYVFVKEITLVSTVIEIAYKMTNLSESGFHYVWSSHPLLRIEEGDRIELIPEPEEVEVYWCSDGALVKGDRVSWKNYEISKGTELSTIPNRSIHRAIKLFTPEKLVSSIKLGKKSGPNVTISIDPEAIPFVGIWLCYAAWPEKGAKGEYTIGLEPTNSNKDELQEAIEHGSAPFLESKKSHEWSMKIEID